MHILLVKKLLVDHLSEIAIDLCNDTHLLSLKLLPIHAANFMT